jgi:hypothetical protein
MTRVTFTTYSAAGGLARYHHDTGRLYVAKPWGMLCLTARPFHAAGINLKRSCQWRVISRVRLDLRYPLGLVDSLSPTRRWSDEAGDYSIVPTNPLDPATANVARAWQAFFDEVGGLKLCQLAASFHPTLQYSVLWHTTRSERLATLAQSNPGLFVGIMLKANKCRRDLLGQPADLYELAKGKQRSIAQQLGFSPDAWRVLARIDPRSLTAKRWKKFRYAWNCSRKLRALARHLPAIGRLTLALLVEPHSLNVLESRVFHELACSTWERDYRENLSLVLWVVCVLRSKENALLPDRFRIHNLSQLINTVNLVESHLPDESLSDLRWLTFPPPPAAGEPGYIEPVRTVADLCLETILMQNCSLSFARGVAAGEMYFFRAYPKYGMQRCTIVLKPVEEEEHRIWEVTEARAKANRPCTQVTLDALECFFQEQQQSVPVGRFARERAWQYASLET